MPTISSNLSELFQSGTLNFAHRGYTKAAPENTLASIQAAIDLGVDGIEFDVRVCKSGEVVVFHDPVIGRMTSGKGLVKNLTLSELRQHNIKFRDAQTSEKIPTLEEVFKLVDNKIALNIEIKADLLPRNHEVEVKVIELVKKYDMQNKTVISSFHPLVVKKLGKVENNILRGFLCEGKSIFGRYAFRFARFLNANSLHIDKSMVATGFGKKAIDNGYLVMVWTVNSRELMKQLMRDGIQVIITDNPDVLKEIKTSDVYV